MADGFSFGDGNSDIAANTAQLPDNANGSGFTVPTSSSVLSPTANTSMGNAIAYGLPGLGTGLVDTIGQSLHIWNNDAVPATLRNLTGSGENSFGDFYTRDQAQLRAGGEIAGMMLPGMAAMKVLKSVNGLREAGTIGEWAKNSSALDVLFGSSADMAASERAIANASTDALQNQGIWAGRTLATPEVIAAKRTYYAKKAVDAARTTVAFELGNYAAFNSSQTFYPADTTYWDQAKWVTGGLGVGVGLEIVAARYAVRGMTQAAIKAAGESSSADFMAIAPSKDADKVLFRPGKRGVGVTAYAGMDADLNQTISVSNNPATLKTNLYQDQVNIKKVMSEQVYQMGYDTHPILPRTTLDNGQIDVALKALKANPTSLMFATKIADVPSSHADFYGDIAKTLDDAKTDYNTAIFAASSKFGDSSPEFLAAQNKAIAALKPIEQASNELHYVLEPTGDWTVFKNRAANWLDENNFSDISRKGYMSPNPADTNKPLKNYKMTLQADNQITIHDNGRVEMPKTPTPMDFSATYAGMSDMINKWKPVEGQQFVLTPQVNWRTLEFTSALAKKYPEAAAAIKFGRSEASVTSDLGKSLPLAGGPLPKTGLRPANLNPDGTVYVGNPGDLHFSISEKYPANFTAPGQQVNTGFVNPQGRFLNREEALKWTNANGQSIKPSANMGNALDAADYREQANNFPINNGTFTSLDDVDFHVLNMKFQEFQKMMPNTSTLPLSKDGSLLNRLKGNQSNFTPPQVLQALNLPTPLGFSDAPLIETFAQAKLQGMTDLSEMFPKPNDGRAFEQPYTQLDLVKKHLQETAGIDDPKQAVPFQGSLLNQTSDAKPLFVAANSAPYSSMAESNINARVQAMRDVQLQKLSQIDSQTSPLLSSVIGKIIGGGQDGGDLSAAANTARAVQTLQDGVLSGTGQVVYQDRINEQFPTLKALMLIAQDGDKFTDDYVTKLSAASLKPQFAQMMRPQNRNDLLDFNRIEQAYRHGWDIDSIVPSPTGQGMVFKLAQDSQINKKLVAEHFPDGGEVDQGVYDYMPDMSVTAKKSGYTPLQVSQPASDLANSISQMSIQSGIENNQLRLALGKTPVQIRNFHLPTPELNKEGTWFVRNPAGRMIATYTGPNFATNEQRAKAAATTLDGLAADSSGIGHVAVPLETVRAEHQINDDNFFSLIDYSDQLAKTGAAIKGGLAHTEIDSGPNTMKAMVRSLYDQYLNIGIRGRAAVFEPELNYARQAAQTATAATRENLGGINIFDRYISTMFSQSPNTGKGTLGQIYGGIEGGLDKALTWLYSFHAAQSPMESNQVGAKITNALLRKTTTQSEFNQFAKTLPDWSPFKDAEAWRESFFKEQSPPSVRKLTGQLSRLSSTMSLRFLDAGTAINNFAGLVTNAPAVVTALRRLPSESTDQWISRTGAWGTQLADGIMTFNPMKAMNQSIKALWSGELAGPMNEAAKHGYFTPEYASLAKALTLPEGPTQQALEKFTQVASYAADHSEMLSRQISWGMGYKIGKDLHGFTDERNAYIFANNFVNDMIGNYSPNNKPAMFQGAVGLPLGAFQTYMTNFYRRMYGYIERGDKGALLAQYAAQASVFGARSVPGYALWNSFFQSDNTGADTFSNRAQRNFPPGVGDLLLNGSLSNIPKIWGGMQGDGFAFYTRGGVDYTQPVPTLLDMSKAPPIQFLADVAKGVGATIKNIFGAGGFSTQQQEEILANFTTNRAMKSIMEMAANAKTDQRGNVIDQGTRDAMHVAAGMMGTQLSSVRQQQDAMNQQRNVQLAQEDLQATLSAHTKAIIRGGNFTVPELQGIINNYITNGGNPAYIGQWLRNDVMTATTPKAQLQMENLAKSGKLLEFEDMLATMQQNAKNPLGSNQKGNQ